jgi:transcriptional regulator with PAS, ATPase and Fis domain
LESGEFIRVGSSQVQKTNVRVIAATNVDLTKAIREGQFREDLYYRLNTVPIKILPLRERSDDVLLLFRKFASDFAEKYKMPSIRLTEDAQRVMLNYRWPGNVRQLKNITEQISIIEIAREISAADLIHYLPSEHVGALPALYNKTLDEKTFSSEREILYKILFDMKKDMNDLKKLVHDLMPDGANPIIHEDNEQLIRTLYHDAGEDFHPSQPAYSSPVILKSSRRDDIQDTEEFVEESLSLENKEIEMIRKSLGKHNGKRKLAARELGISERTLYRKIKEYNIE